MKSRQLKIYLVHLKDLFKDALQQMMHAEFDTSMGYSKCDKNSEKQITEMVIQKRN